jgi:Ca2+-binding EF-hand superfamily protein
VIFVSTAPFNWKARSLFELYDADKSTTLSLDEVTVMMSNAMNVLMYIEGKPTQPISVIAENVKSFFKANDTDGDNKINFTEFKTYLKTDKRILAAITSSGVIATDEIGIDFGSHTNEVPAFD